MKNDYSKYSEKLSAYLDGELPPEEMAQIANALEKDKKLAAEFDRLVKLHNLTENSLPDIQDGILDDLENRIVSNLEDKPLQKTSKESSPKKIIPVWRKNIAIAATIAVFFLAGRIAYQEYGTDILSPVEDKKVFSPKITSPSVADSIAPEEHILQDSITVDEKSKPLKEAVITERQDLPALEESVGDISVEEKITLPQPITPETRIEGQGYVADEKDTDDFKPQESAIKEDFEAVQLTKPQVNQTEVSINALAMPEFKKDKRERLAATGELEGEFSIASIDSLSEIFNNYADPKSRTKLLGDNIKTFSYADSARRLDEPVLQLWDSLKAIQKFDQPSTNIENHYLKILAARKLYQITGDKHYYEEAIAGIKSLKSLIDSKLSQHPENKNLLEYKDKLGNFELVE